MAPLFMLLASLAAALCPLGMAEIGGAYCIDKYEASLADWSPYKVLDDTKLYTAESRPLKVPQGYISQRQAAKACANAGKRLCTSDEWKRACNLAYKAGICNEHSKDKKYASAYKRVYPNPKWDGKEMNDPRINQQPDSVKPSGAMGECKTSEEVMDMIGNLHEWVADVRDKGMGTFRGGYYVEADKNGEGCAYQTTAHNVDYHDYSTGFRCCRDSL